MVIGRGTDTQYVGRIRIVCSLMAAVFIVAQAQAAGAAPAPMVVGCPERTELRAGEQFTCDLRLAQSPGMPIRIRLHSNLNRLAFEPEAPIFDQNSWAVPQRVTVTAVEDQWLDPLVSTVGVGATPEEDHAPQGEEYQPFVQFLAAFMAGIWRPHDNLDPNVAPNLVQKGSAYSGISAQPIPLASQTPDDLNHIWLGSVRLTEPRQGRDFLEVHPSSKRIATEGASTVLWVRPSAQPRFPFQVEVAASSTLRRTRVGALLGGPTFTPQNWTTYQPIHWGRTEDLTRQARTSGELLLYARYGADDLDDHLASWLALAIPRPRSHVDPRLAKSLASWPLRPLQPFAVTQLDNDARTVRQQFTVAFLGGAQPGEKTPFSCSAQRKDRDGMNWTPRPLQFRNGYPVIGYEPTLWGRTSTHASWRVIGRGKAEFYAGVPKPEPSSWQYRTAYANVPRAIRFLRVTCATPAGVRSLPFATPSLAPPT